MMRPLPHRFFPDDPWSFQYTDEQWLRIRDALVRAGFEAQADETSHVINYPMLVWKAARRQLVKFGIKPNDSNQSATITSDSGSAIRDRLNNCANYHLQFMQSRNEILETSREVRRKNFKHTIVQLRKARKALQNALVEVFAFNANKEQHENLIEMLNKAEEICTRACNHSKALLRPQKDEDLIELVISEYLGLGGHVGNDSGPAVEFVRAATEPLVGAKSPLLTGPALRARLRRQAQGEKLRAVAKSSHKK
jgi:hypothetical protein